MSHLIIPTLDHTQWFPVYVHFGSTAGSMFGSKTFWTYC